VAISQEGRQTFPDSKGIGERLGMVHHRPIQFSYLQVCCVYMKTLIKVLIVCGLVALIAWAMAFISSEGSSMRLNNDWGIAKDRPIK
jgi:hypothetical protein